MVAVTGKFLLTDDTPETGRVTFSPLVMAVDDTPDVHFVTRQIVSADLDENGIFTLDVTPSDDSGWRLSEETMLAGGMPYRVLLALSKDRRMFTVYVPDGAGHDLSDLVDLDAVPEVITVPTPGPENVLSIGDVLTSAPGSDAEVTIEGDSPEQILNFTLPRGETGPANVLTVGDVTTGAPGSTADVEISGTAPNQVVDFVIPRGDKGETGDPNVLSIGTVTTGDPGTDADADISGDTPNQVLNLAIPRGTPGYIVDTVEPVNHDVFWYDPSEPDESEVYLQRNIDAGFGLLGGGTLVDDLSFEVDPSVVALQTDLEAHTSSTNAHGIADTADLVLTNDERLTDARTPVTHTHPEADVTGLTAALGLKAPLASPTFTGTVTVPNPAAGSETTVAASTAFAAERAKIGNLLTANQASVETDLAGFSVRNRCSISRSTTYARHGSASLSVTATADTTSGSVEIYVGGTGNNGIPVESGSTYTIIAYVRQSVPRTVGIVLRGVNTSGAYLSENSPTIITPVADQWTRVESTWVIPAGVAYVSGILTTCYAYGGGQIGDVTYVDCFSIHKGAGGEWAMPGIPVPNLASRSGAYSTMVENWDGTQWIPQPNGSMVGNLLTANIASGGDTLGTAVGSHTTYGNVGFSRSTQQASRGTGSWRFAVSVDGQTVGGRLLHTTGTSRIPVLPETPYTISADKIMAAGSQSGKVLTFGLTWRDSTDATVGSIFYISHPLTAVWTRDSNTVVSPSTAATVEIAVYISGALTTDAYYVDCLGFWAGAGGEWAMPGVPITNLGRRVTHPNVDDVLVQNWDASLGRWQTVHYDSGWRDISALSAALTDWTINTAHARRVGTRVTLKIAATRVTNGGSIGIGSNLIGLPQMLRPAVALVPPTLTFYNGTYIACTVLARVYGGSGGVGYYLNPRTSGGTYATGNTWQGEVSYELDSSVIAIPTSLPGTLVSAAPA